MNNPMQKHNKIFHLRLSSTITRRTHHAPVRINQGTPHTIPPFTPHTINIVSNPLSAKPDIGSVWNRTTETIWGIRTNIYIR
jgi:hypothetical protein